MLLDLLRELAALGFESEQLWIERVLTLAPRRREFNLASA